MAQIAKIGEWQEANNYLLNLRKTITDDIVPLLNTVGSAPFAINREILSYIDHLGHLYSGNDKVGDRSKKYLKMIMSEIDDGYSQRADEIYNMYRCGTVHEFEPKTLQDNKGNLLSWLCYNGERIDEIKIEGIDYKLTHLKPLLSQIERKYWLPMSTKCLIQDTIESINIFISDSSEDERVTSWNRARHCLSEPVSFDFKI